jgi:hypothetical protein
MTYDAFESSVQDAKPIFLFEFTTELGATRYTSSPVAVTHAGEDWLPSPVTPPEAVQSTGLNRNGMRLTFPRTDALALTMLSDQLDTEVDVVILRKGVGGDVFRAFWVGRVAAAMGEGGKIHVECESILTSLRRAGPRRRYQKPCPHAHYGRGCNLVLSEWEDPKVYTAVDNTVITITGIDAYPEGWFFGGILEAPNGIRRMIVDHDATSVTILFPIDNLADELADAVGDVSVILYPGCDRSMGTCDTKFDNLDNHGGFNWTPRKNPMGGSSIL